MVELMPVIWLMCAAAALLLLLCGEWGAPSRAFPAILAGVAMHAWGFPPRLQAVAFAGMYGITLILWLVVRKVRRTGR